jgi:hypothetical protein
LISQACVPYFEMLEKWIYKGIIYDPYGEVSQYFFVTAIINYDSQLKVWQLLVVMFQNTVMGQADC